MDSRSVTHGGMSWRSVVGSLEVSVGFQVSDPWWGELEVSGGVAGGQ